MVGLVASQCVENAFPVAAGHAPALLLFAGETSAANDVSNAYLTCEQEQVANVDCKREWVMSFIGERENRF